MMSRFPELTIRIDVEHDIINPVAENYDIVFAMLETPLPSNGIIIRKMFSLERGLFAATVAAGAVRRAEKLGRADEIPAADRSERCALGDHDAGKARWSISRCRRRGWSVPTPMCGCRRRSQGTA